MASGLIDNRWKFAKRKNLIRRNTTSHGLKRYILGQGRCFFGMAKRPNALVGFNATMNPRGA
jgi:hypothetical protein